MEYFQWFERLFGIETSLFSPLIHPENIKYCSRAKNHAQFDAFDNKLIINNATREKKSEIIATTNVSVIDTEGISPSFWSRVVFFPFEITVGRNWG